jgi:hypothetical protein
VKDLNVRRQIEQCRLAFQFNTRLFDLFAEFGEASFEFGAIGG